MIWDHTGLFLLRNQSHDSMTLCELLHQVAWDDIRPHIERHLPERPETKLADYKRLFELARETAPDRTTYIPRTPLTFRFCVPECRDIVLRYPIAPCGTTVHPSNRIRTSGRFCICRGV